jgi:hypothetical protein
MGWLRAIDFVEQPEDQREYVMEFVPGAEEGVQRAVRTFDVRSLDADLDMEHG